MPAIPGHELRFTSNEAFALPALPRRIAILGGGYIAVEFAGIFNGLGCEVTLAYRGPEFLRGFDDDVRHFLRAEMEKGIRIRLKAPPAALAKRGDGAIAVAQTLFGGRPTAADHADVPTAVFSQPPIGTVGLTEAQALATYREIDVYRTEFRPMKHTLSGRDERTLMKLVVDTASQRVVGAHMLGTDAPEIIQAIGIAVKAKLTKAGFDATVGIHPTAAEEFVTLREKVTRRGEA